MKKLGVLILILFIMSAVLVLADDTNTSTNTSVTDTSLVGVDKAFDCLETLVETRNCSSLTTEEKAFALLALSYDPELRDDCKNALMAEKDSNNCWPAGSCKLKETALVTLALHKLNEDTGDYETWLLNQNKTIENLIWYLQIDADTETTCKIGYSDAEYEITIGANKKINQGAGSCLSPAMSNYWLQISDTCLNREFAISCDEGFFTNLLYKKSDSSTIYVSSETHSAAANGKTNEQVNVLCFKENGRCDYEGSLWAALALENTGADIEPFRPYLIALAPDNEKYGANAFLLMIEGDSYLSRLITSQTITGYWRFMDSTYNQFYDTALALMALYNRVAEDADTAKEWLLDHQTNEGCWNNNNIRDTAFILYAAWRRAPSTSNIGGATIEYCDVYGGYCSARTDCESGGGIVLNNFFCLSGVCCDREPSTPSCSEQGGQECTSGTSCDRAPVIAADTNDCCLSNCVTPAQDTECEQQSYYCRSSCLSGEVEKPYDCDSGYDCCGAEPVTPGVEPTKSYWWIWLLIILIILVVIAIIFRDKIKTQIFAMKSKFKKSPPSQSQQRNRMFSPMMGPVPRLMRPGPRPMGPPRSSGRPPAKQASSSKVDKDYEDTLKKLKEMGGG